jgi:hypothetical protein
MEDKQMIHGPCVVHNSKVVMDQSHNLHNW